MSLKPLPLTLATLTAILYIAGYTVAQFHAAALDVGRAELLRSNYLTTGVVVLLAPAILLSLIMWIFYHIKEASASTPRSFVGILRIFCVLAGAVGVLYFYSQLPDQSAKLTGQKLDVDVWRNILRLQFFASIFLVVLPVVVAVASFTTTDYSRIHWSSWSIRAIIMLPFLLFYLFFSSVYIYPFLPSALGGARPISVRLQLDVSLHLGEVWPVSEGWIGPCSLLYRSGAEVVIEKDGHRLILPAGKVILIEPGAPFEPLSDSSR